MTNVFRVLLVAGLGLLSACDNNPNFRMPWDTKPQAGYTTVTVVRNGQPSQRQVPCGSEYYDGHQQRIAPRC